ncbi:hypothetical protein NDU88_002634 [Pleurodeles waltl]|uniref:Uncharacterized protein n=1 Tax=Pleurodeles waltl TaxID=8319 RepID=A0AAV7WP49_PLEWA|nr:hypothetical protein NDU88_002634 [Pleurodeles waltl]
MQVRSWHPPGLSQARRCPPKQAASVAKGPKAQKGAPPPARGHGSPKGHPTAQAPNLREPRPDRPPDRLSHTLSLPAVHSCRERPQSLTSPRRKSARGAEGSSRPGPVEPDHSAALGRPRNAPLVSGAPGEAPPGPPQPPTSTG